MTRVVCKICGESDLFKQDGAYVCACCGERYAPSEVLDLLVGFDSPDDKGGARREHAHHRPSDIKDLLELAAGASAMGNHFEAETYCRKALALDPNSYQLRRMLAQTVGMQLTTDDGRTEEAIRLYAEALMVAPDEFREALQREAVQMVDAAIRARATKLATQYEKSGDIKAAQELAALPQYVADRLALLSEATGATVADDSLAVFVATTMNNAAVRVWGQHVLPAYAADEHRDKATMDEFVRDGDAVMTVVMSSIALSPARDEGRYASLVSIGRQLAGAHSMRRQGWRWVKDASLADEEKVRRLGYVADWEEKAKRAADVQSDPTSATGERAKRAGRGSVWHREATWKVTVSLLCFARVLWKMDALDSGDVAEVIVWLVLGVTFMAMWCLEDS